MPIPTVTEPIYYVYALLREDGTPFYVGMGKGDRWLQHEKLAKSRRNHKDHIICDILKRCPTVPKIKLIECISKVDAIALEIALIQLIGRTPGGPLVNITKGGEGILGMSPEREHARKEAVAAAQKRPDVRAKKSIAAKGKKLGPRSPEIRAKLSAAVRGFRHTVEARRKIAEAGRGRTLNPLQLAKLAEARQQPRSAVTKARISQSLRGHVQSQATRAKRSASHKGKKMSPEAVEKMRIAARNRSTATREKIRANMIRIWKTRNEFHN